MARAISKDFFKDLQSGVLSQLLERVKIDDTLDLELRGKSINIYYRGRSLFRITENSAGSYDIFFNLNYCDTEAWKNTGNIVIENPSIKQAVQNIPFYKQAMDMCLSKSPKYENEAQQRIVLENNNQLRISNGTDYFIVDTEYAFNTKNIAAITEIEEEPLSIEDDDTQSKINVNSRFDMIALKWLSDRTEHRYPKNTQLAIIELKYGDGALGGTAGIKKHLTDIDIFIHSGYLSAFNSDMTKVFAQKRQLGLINALANNKNSVIVNYEKPEAMFVFANHDPASTILFKILRTINPRDYDFTIWIAEASFMGYGLYVDRIKELSEFQKEHNCVYDPTAPEVK